MLEIVLASMLMLSYSHVIVHIGENLTMPNPVDIKSLNHSELETLLKQMGEPRFRVRQLEQWLYKRGASTFEEMTNLSSALRTNLAEGYFIGIPSLAAKQVSQDGTRKYLFRLSDGATVESVGIPSKDGTRLTVCFSTQAGCPMNCSFCATGQGGFTRNLNVGEIYDQVRLVGDDFEQRVSNAVAMGQGEPFLNYDNVLAALRYLNSADGMEIGARHITVSTCGLIDGIQRFSEEPEQFTLAISLHSSIQEVRDELMPGVQNIKLPALKNAIKDYGEKTKRRPTLEYALINDTNDTFADVDSLTEFCRGMLCHVNLIPLNPIDRSTLDDSSLLLEPSKHMKEFESELVNRGLEVSIRSSRGGDIDGACGQLKQRVTE